MKKKLIVLGGLLLILLSLFHLSFWSLFNWQEELSKLSDMNSGIMQLSAVGFASLFLYLGIILIGYRAKLLIQSWEKLCCLPCHSSFLCGRLPNLYFQEVQFGWEYFCFYVLLYSLSLR